MKRHNCQILVYVEELLFVTNFVIAVSAMIQQKQKEVIFTKIFDIYIQNLQSTKTNKKQYFNS